MRKLAAVFTLLLLLPATASAKTGIVLQSTPDGLAVGEPWDASFVYMRNDAPVEAKHASIRITNQRTGATASFPANRLHNGMWAARVIFRQPGRWTYRVEGFGARAAHQFWDPVTIRPRPRPATHASPVQESSFPYGWVGGGAAFALATVVLLARRRLS